MARMNQSAFETRLLELANDAREAGIDRDTILATFDLVITVLENDDDE